MQHTPLPPPVRQPGDARLAAVRVLTALLGSAGSAVGEALSCDGTLLGRVGAALSAAAAMDADAELRRACATLAKAMGHGEGGSGVRVGRGR